ncbi:MAG TPA: hypothetical protein VNY10_13355 [Roseiarcus sp.]|jgi:hypothetical protein|nr:hypothetical protein [Roseiarcus sp.]
MNPGLIPPAEVAAAAKRGLELREKFHRGGTSVGVHRAKELSERGPLSLRDVVAMSAYFARHEVDRASMSHDGATKPTHPLAISLGCFGAASPAAVGLTV